MIHAFFSLASYAIVLRLPAYRSAIVTPIVTPLAHRVRVIGGFLAGVLAGIRNHDYGCAGAWSGQKPN